MKNVQAQECKVTMSKQDLLNTIYTEVAACRKCGLWKSRKNTVPGDGSINATVMFIGEAPGYWEDVKMLETVTKSEASL